MDSSVSLKDEIWFLRVCHHIFNAVYLFPLNPTGKPLCTHAVGARLGFLDERKSPLTLPEMELNSSILQCVAKRLS